MSELTPDQLHDLRNSVVKEVEEHILPSRKTIEMINNVEKDFDEKLNKTIELLNIKIESKVSWVVFWSILTLMTGIMIGMFGLLYKKVEDTSKDIKNTSEAVFYIKGTLDKAEITQ